MRVHRTRCSFAYDDHLGEYSGVPFAFVLRDCKSAGLMLHDATDPLPPALYLYLISAFALTPALGVQLWRGAGFQLTRTLPTFLQSIL